MAIVIQFPGTRSEPRASAVPPIEAQEYDAKSTLDPAAQARMAALEKSCEELAQDMSEASRNIQRLLTRMF